MASPTQEPAPRGGPVGRETALLNRIGTLLKAASFVAPPGETWFGDDAAVLGPLDEGFDALFCTDLVVAGVHGDLALSTLADLGWKAVMATVSDLAAMGGDPRALLCSIAGPMDELDEAMDGVVDAARAIDCPVVGGDVSSAPVTVISIAALGAVPHETAVLRSGARPGDAIVLTGPVGGAAAGLRALRAGEANLEAAIARHRRPRALLEEGTCARSAGVSAMIDVSDGTSLDLHRLADASNVGFVVDRVPCFEGASRDEALGGGEDFELVMTTSDPERLCSAFVEQGLVEPIVIGTIVSDPQRREIEGRGDTPMGWRHDS
jgi:thiamine-monophosphate kinase